MASDVKAKGIGGGGAGSKVAYRVARANLITGTAGVAACALFKTHAATGFAAGYIIGVINIFWLLRIARKGTGMAPDRAVRFVTRRYYIRFLTTALVFALLISRGILPPAPLLVGLTGAILTTIIVMISLAREEAF